MLIESKSFPLGELPKGTKAIISQVGYLGSDLSKSSETKLFIKKILKMGFTEGTLIEIVHEAPFTRDPIMIRIRNSLIALRRHDANAIKAQPCSFEVLNKD